jgi:DNA-binding CsgD family transcriptional regulator
MALLTWQDGTPLVGRGRELAILTELLQRARDGQSALALVVGAPGLGKTRLLLELAQRARRDDWQVLLGRAYDAEGMPPYLPFIEGLREYQRAQAPGPRETSPELALLFPDTATRATPSWNLTPAGQDPEGQRYRLFEAVCNVLLDIARTPAGGLLLCLDDLHWADTPTLQLLVHLVRRLDEAPVLLVCSYRSSLAAAAGPLTDTLARLSRERACQRIVLNALSRLEIEALVEGLAGPASPPVVEMIHRQTGGNPFFVHELVRHLLEHGHDLSRTDVDATEWGVPETVNQIIGQRLSVLGANANHLLQVAAVIGDALTLEILGAVLQLPPLPLVDALEEALGSGFVREAGDVYQFEHALVRQTIQQRLTAVRRKSLHLAVAEALERVSASPHHSHVSEIAFHYTCAGDLAPADKTLDYAERAGDAANVVLAYEEAVAHWQVALQHMERQAVAPERRAQLLERLGNLTYLAGIDYAAGITYLERALQLYDSGAQPEHAARVNLRLGIALSALPETWDLPRAVRHYRRAEALLSEGPPDATLGYVYAGLAQVAIWDVRIADGLEASARGLEVAERVDDDALWAHAAMSRGCHQVSSGHIREGLDLVHRAWQVADKLNDPVVFLIAFLGSAFAHWLADPLEFRLWSDRELAGPRVHHAPGQRVRLLARSASARALAGDFSSARAILEEVGPSYDAWDALFWLGEWQTCESLARTRIERSTASGERAFALEAAYDLARLRRAQGEHDAARELLEQALAVAMDGGERAYEVAVRTLLALVCVDTQHVPVAQEHATSARQIVANGEDWRGLAGQLALAEGALALASGQFVAAEKHFERSLAIARHFANPFAEVEVHIVWSRGLLARGLTPSATNALRTAEAMYRRIGANDVWLTRLDSTSPTANPDGLSEREVEVLRLVAAGRTNREIADELVISVNTVARHISNIFVKAGVANRAEAASYAHRHALTNKDW